MTPLQNTLQKPFKLTLVLLVAFVLINSGCNNSASTKTETHDSTKVADSTNAANMKVDSSQYQSKTRKDTTKGVVNPTPK